MLCCRVWVRGGCLQCGPRYGMLLSLEGSVAWATGVWWLTCRGAVTSGRCLQLCRPGPRGIRLWVYSCELSLALGTYVRPNAVLLYLTNSPALAAGALPGGSVSSGAPAFFYSVGTTRSCSSFCVSLPLEAPISLRSLATFHWRKILGNKTLSPGALMAPGMSLPLGFLRRQSPCACAQAHLPTLLPLSLHPSTQQSVSSNNREPIPTSIKNPI